MGANPFVDRLLRMIRRFDERGQQATPLPFFQAFPDAAGATVPLGDVSYHRWNMDPLEQYCIAAIALARRPKTVFEIGTFDGSTTYLLAKVLPTARIVTLDLPPETYARPSTPHPQRDAGTAESVDRDSIGSRFHGQPEGDRITQLVGDSRTFDYADYLGKVDLVIVDGSHEYETVTIDTANALRMVSSSGLVIWDDYAGRWPGVVRAVDEAAQRQHLEIVRIAPTDLAVFDPSRRGSRDSAL